MSSDRAEEAVAEPRAASMPEVVYVVQEINWRYNDEHYHTDEGEADGGPVGYPLHAFTSREKAEAHRLRKELEQRPKENPFSFGGRWADLSTAHRPESLLALVRELGLPEPRGYDGMHEALLRDWEEWYYRLKKAGGLSAEQAERFWEALDLVTHFEVVEVRLGGAGGDRP
jgi:hypothetical protein